jgi:hypothetical protein
MPDANPLVLVGSAMAFSQGHDTAIINDPPEQAVATRYNQPAAPQDGINLPVVNVKEEPVSVRNHDPVFITPAPQKRPVQPLVNPYAKKQLMVNPYAKKQRTSDATTTSNVTFQTVPSPLKVDQGTASLQEANQLNSIHTVTTNSAAPTPDDSPDNQNTLRETNRPATDAVKVKFPKHGSDAFLTALFRTPIKDYVYCESKDKFSESMKIWEQLCERTDLRTLKSAVPAVQNTVQEHFEMRAALVLEEARETLAQALTSLWNRKERKYYESFEDLTIKEQTTDDSELAKKGMKKIIFKRRPTHVDKKKDRFSTEEIGCLQSGSLCLLQECGSHTVKFAFIQPNSNERLQKKKEFEVLCVELEDAEDDAWKSPHGHCNGEGVKLIPLQTTFISLSR